MADNLLYVSWGGSGRNDTVEAAALQTAQAGGSFVYLGIVDNAKFGDVASATLEMLIEELDFILRAQTKAVMRHINSPETASRVIVRRGDVGTELRTVAAEIGVSTALVGGPLPIRDQRTAAEVIASLESETGLKLTLI